jgi:hypothetical protein
MAEQRVMSEVERRLRGYAPRVVLDFVRPVYPQARATWTGQEDASSQWSSPRSVDAVEPSGADNNLSRQDRKRWLWARYPLIVTRYRLLRKTRSCPDSLIAKYDYGW